MSDPRLQGVTITFVRLSGDLQLANVYYRVYDQDSVETAHAGLLRSGGLLRKHLANQLRVRRVPELRFFYDESVEKGARIEQLLSQSKQEG